MRECVDCSIRRLRTSGQKLSKGWAGVAEDSRAPSSLLQCFSRAPSFLLQCFSCVSLAKFQSPTLGSGHKDLGRRCIFF